MVENKSLIWATVGVLSGAALLYFLSKDNGPKSAYDPKVHSDERMFELMDELMLEYGCILVRHYNLILRLKEQQTFEKQMLNDLKVQCQHEQDDKFRQVCSHYPGFTPEIVLKWVSDNAKHPRITK